MSLELSGKVVKLLPMQSGQSQRGPWKKQEMILETNEQYPKKIAISCWSEKVDEIQNLAAGTNIKVSINIESREYNDKWYTDVRAWKIEPLQASQPVDNTNTASFNSINDEPTNMVFTADETDDDLPF
ncbi:MAG: DUF3127 domain-containing protein [Flavobacteriales bacterium]|nr:DUF3127 domain-containing protein [Flavobacteriales bacterium]